MSKLINNNVELDTFIKKVLIKKNGQIYEANVKEYKDGEWKKIDNSSILPNLTSITVEASKEKDVVHRIDEDNVDGYYQVIVPKVLLQDKILTIDLSEGTQTINCDERYIGFDTITIEKPENAENLIAYGKTLFGIEGALKSGASLNIHYSDTPPADTSKLWLNCNEPSGVEIQNYLGECAVSNVLEYGTIENPTTSSYFYYSYFSTCYIGNNQIAIVGYNHIRIYDLVSKSYIADYKISVSTASGYTNVILKDNVLYFGRYKELYSFNLTTQTLTKLYEYDEINYIAFYTDNEIDLYSYDDYRSSSYVYRFNLTNNTATQILYVYNESYFYNISSSTVKANDTLYNFNYYSAWKYVDNANSITYFTSFTDFIKNTFNSTTFAYSSAIYDNERYIYLIGGGNGTIGYDSLIKYDTVNDTFELLDTKLLSGKYNALSVLVDNRVYFFGGSNSTSSGYGRTNYIDYFDLKYPLNENNAIVTTNAINTDVMVNLINEDTFKLKSNVASAYIGNADNLAEKVNAYYHNGNAWLGINTVDPFEWKIKFSQSCGQTDIFVLDLNYNNNLDWETNFSVETDANDIVVGGIVDNQLQITALDVGIGNLTLKNETNNSIYSHSIEVSVLTPIVWATIPSQTCIKNSSISIDLNSYYTNNSVSQEPTFSVTVAGDGFSTSITSENVLVITNNTATSATTFIVTADIGGIYSTTTFNVAVE